MKPPAEALFVLGRTTEADIRAQYGAPTSSERETTPQGSATGLPSGGSPFDAVPFEGTYTRLRYALTNEAEARLLGGDTKTKTAEFLLWNDVLIDYHFNSSFEADATTFDLARLKDVAIGRTIEAQVISLLGPPSGRGIFPAVRDPGSHVLHYNYFAVHQGFFVWQRDVQRQHADVLIDEHGFVQAYRGDDDAALPMNRR
ncbi:hypothetical protein [Zavarzinia sp.]|uniref:hypothetical protein n=1 Tax=Zavarzinia sp. TaxID=2027920 RepID=UPI0035630AB6